MSHNSQGTQTHRPGRRFSHLLFENLPPNYTHSTQPIFEELSADVKDQDIVCVPSLSFDQTEMLKVVGGPYYEERPLFVLFFLRHPSTRIIYITSTPLDERIVQYYLSMMHDVSPSEIKGRLIFLSANDSSPKPLSAKILDRPRLIERIKSIIRPSHSCMLCISTTQAEQDLATQLGIPLIGNNPAFDYLGTKSGSRDVFQICNIPHPLGVPKKTDAIELASAISELLQSNPSIMAMVVKLDSGFSGHGNALLDLSSLSGRRASSEDVLKQMASMKFFSPTEKWEHFEKKITILGAIAEEYISDEVDCPSVQAYITLNGDVELLSTHDQIIKSQIYQGCTFPASQDYRVCLNDYGSRIGKLLAEKGARGYFGVDFLVTKTGSVTDICALEINLRQCGTTHPYFAMKLLNGGLYDKKSGLLYSNQGTPKYYRATDNLTKPQYRGLLPADIIEFTLARDLMYSPITQTGIILHLMGPLSAHGKVGFTAIADSAEEAAQLFNEVEKMLDYETSDEVKRVMTLVADHPQIPLTRKPIPLHLSPQNSAITFGGNTKCNTKMFITVCVHGDEVCGMHAINQLISDGFFKKLPDDLQITVMCANPLAVIKGVRFVDQNLNRCILPHIFEKGGYETFRARAIANKIFDSDVYLDVHSTSTPTPSICLPAANAQSESLACNLPVAYVVQELAHATEVRGTTIDWAYFHKKTAVSVECGQHQAPESVQVAKQIIQTLVANYAQNSPPASHPLISSPPKLMTCVGREKVAPGFKFLKAVKPFDHVKFGEVLAEDENGPITCPFDIHNQGAIVTMPSSIHYVGEEAYFWVVPSGSLEISEQ